METLATCLADVQKVKNLQTLNLPESVKNGLNYAFSVRDFGNMSFNHGPAGEVSANRQRFLAAAGIELNNVIAMRPVHGAHVEDVGQSNRGNFGRGAFDIKTGIDETDALITTEPEVALVVNPADCAPIIITNHQTEFLAMIHAGRDGTDQEIGPKTVARLQEMGFDPKDFVAGIGPTNTCYQQSYIKTDNPERWLPFLLLPKDSPADIVWEETNTKDGPLFRIQPSLPGIKLDVDLVGANKAQLIQAGLKPESIHFSGYCTACNLLDHQDNFSHAVSLGAVRDDEWTRNLKGPKQYPDGRFMAVAQLI